MPLRNGPNVTVVAALTPQGLEAVREVDGAVNTASFVAYLEQVPGPTLVPGEVVVLDKLARAQGPRCGRGRCRLRGSPAVLAPYSPDFTPIELAFSKFETSLRTAQARTRDMLTEALRTALEWISETDAKNWFDHYGYHVH